MSGATVGATLGATVGATLARKWSTLGSNNFFSKLFMLSNLFYYCSPMSLVLEYRSLERRLTMWNELENLKKALDIGKIHRLALYYLVFLVFIKLK
jgi:hypothetical protein